MLSKEINKIFFKTAIFEAKAQALIKKANANFKQAFFSFQPDINQEDFDEWVVKNQSIMNKYLLNSNWFSDGSDTMEARVYAYRDPGGKDLMLYLTKDRVIPTDFSNFEGKESHLIHGHKSIPNMYLSVGKDQAEGTHPRVRPVSKELAHENWLIDSLSELLNEDPNDHRFINKVNMFIAENQEIIKQIKSFFQTTKPKILGAGADGVALAIAPKLILKIFASNMAYRKAKEAMERLHQGHPLGKTEPMFYDVGELGKFTGGRILYYYIQERMTPVKSIHLGKSTDTIRNALSEIVNHFEHAAQKDRSLWLKLEPFFNDKKELSKVKHHIKTKAHEYVQSIDPDSHEQIKIDLIEELLEGSLRKDWLHSLAEEIIVKRLTDRDDLHMGNIGLTPYGHFRYFDPVI